MATTKTLKVRIKDKHAGVLCEWARAVNFTWNYINDESGLKGLSNVQIVKKVRDIVSLASSHLFCLVLPSTLSALPYLALFPQPDFLRQIVCGIDQ